MKEYVEFLQSEFVLWIYYEGNDLQEVIREKASFFARYYSDSGFSQNLMHRQAEIDQALIEFIQRYKQKESARLEEEKSRRESKWRRAIKLEAIRARLSRVMAQSPRPDHSPYPDSMFSAILAKAQEKTSSWAGKLCFVYLPEYYRYTGQVNHDHFHQRREVLSIIRGLDVPIIDIHEISSTQPEPLSFFPYRVYGHYTAPGYRLVAEAIFSYLQRE
ncbi:MAG: hypothetical protein ACRENG_20510, partial [bacterium]